MDLTSPRLPSIFFASNAERKASNICEQSTENIEKRRDARDNLIPGLFRIFDDKMKCIQESRIELTAHLLHHPKGYRSGQ
jgi:hypothetical protein